MISLQDMSRVRCPCRARLRRSRLDFHPRFMDRKLIVEKKRPPTNNHFYEAGLAVLLPAASKRGARKITSATAIRSGRRAAIEARRGAGVQVWIMLGLVFGRAG